MDYTCDLMVKGIRRDLQIQRTGVSWCSESGLCQGSCCGKSAMSGRRYLGWAADKMEAVASVNKENFLKTVAKYNESCDSGYDPADEALQYIKNRKDYENDAKPFSISAGNAHAYRTLLCLRRSRRSRNRQTIPCRDLCEGGLTIFGI